MSNPTARRVRWPCWHCRIWLPRGAAPAASGRGGSRHRSRCWPIEPQLSSPRAGARRMAGGAASVLVDLSRPAVV